MVKRSTWQGERSSSSSAPDASFTGFLWRSLELLAREQPQAHARMCAALAPRRVLIEVDDEAVLLRFKGKKVRIKPGLIGTEQVRARTSRRTIMALVDADLSLMDSVWMDRFEMWGTLEDLVAFHDGLMFYLHGAVRARAFPGLLRGFRDLEASG